MVRARGRSVAPQAWQLAALIVTTGSIMHIPAPLLRPDICRSNQEPHQIVQATGLKITKLLDLRKETERPRMLSTRNNGHGSIGHVTNLIMLIEDDINHAELVIRTTQKHPIPNQIHHFSEGQSALDYLFRRKSFSDPASSPRPQIILLDLHLPGIDGIDILRIIKASDELKMIPVIILTTSATERDLTRAYGNHANSYLIKPVGCEEFKELMDILCFYWLGNNMKPKI